MLLVPSIDPIDEVKHLESLLVAGCKLNPTPRRLSQMFAFNQLLDAVKMGWNILIVYGCGCMSRKSIPQLHSPLINVQMGHFLLSFSTNGEEEMC